MKKNVLLGLIPSICLLYANLNAQVATLSVADTSGSPNSSNNCLNIELDNTMGVAGVQFTLTFDGNLLTATSADTTMRTSHMSMGYNSWTDSIKVLMYSMTGDSILAGSGPIVKIIFDVSSSALAGDSTSLYLKDAVLSDPKAQAISVNTEDGWFHFVSVGVRELSKAGIKPSTYMLDRNIPNPFTFKTTICYQMPVKSDVNLKIFNLTGQMVRTLIDEQQEAGYHAVGWDGRDDNGKRVAAGMYFCKFETHANLEADKYRSIKKIILLR